MKKSRTLYMETTKIPAGQTVAEIQRILGEYGASAVMTEYDKGEVQAVVFKILFLDKAVPFRLPCRWEPIYSRFLNRRKRVQERSKDTFEDQAKRVAWRQILRWVEAQMALVETSIVQIHEVFLPYMQVDIKGTTLCQHIEQTKFKMLNAPSRSADPQG